MDTIYKTVKPIFDVHRKLPSVEIELRLGRINGSMFDTDIGKETFQKLLDGLTSYDGWEKVINSITSVYQSGNKRLVINDDTDQSVYMIKKKILNENIKLPDYPLDIRMGVSQEIILHEEPSEEMDSVKVRKRVSFIRKNVSIDLTIVSGDPDDLDNEEPEVYQVELEIINPSNVSNDGEFYNIVYKSVCLLNLLN